MSEQSQEREFHPIISENFDIETGLTKNTAYIQDLAGREDKFRTENPRMAGDNEANYQSDVDYVANKAITLDAMKEDVANAELGMLNATAASTESLVSDNLKELARVRANNLTGIGQGDNSTTPSSPSSPGEVVRRRVPQVVNPYDGRIVPYGQMQPGDHSEGGRIVGYR